MMMRRPWLWSCLKWTPRRWSASADPGTGLRVPSAVPFAAVAARLRGRALKV